MVNKSILYWIASFCFVFDGLINLNTEERICMYIEFLAAFLYFKCSLLMVNGLSDFIYMLCRKLNHYSKAIIYQERCLDLAKKYGNQELQTLLYKQIGDLHFASGNFEYAFENNKRSLVSARITKNKEMEAIALGALGELYLALCKNDEAKENFEQCLHLAQQINCETGKMFAYAGLGSLHSKLHDKEKAIDFFEKALQIAESTGEKSYICNMYGRLGDVYLKFNDYKKAMDFYQKDLNIAIEIGDKGEESKVYGSLGSISLHECQYDKAMEYCNKQIKIAKQIGSKNDEATGYFQLGMNLFFTDDNLKAIKQYEKALQIYLVTGDKDGEQIVYRSIGKANIYLGKYQEALKFFDKALETAKEEGDKKGEVVTLAQMGTLYNLMGRPPSEVIDCYKKRLAFSKLINDKQNQIYALSNMGDTYLYLGNIKQAKEYYENQLVISIEIEDKYCECQAICNLGRVLYSEGKHTQAVDFLEKSLKIALKIEDKSTEMNINLLLAYCYRSLGNYTEAILCNKKALNIAILLKDKQAEFTVNSQLGNLFFEIANDERIANKETNAAADNFKKAEEHLREAIRGSDSLFHHLHELDDFKISIFKTFTLAYNTLTDVLVATKQFEEALLVSERGRGRALSDLLISKYHISLNDAISRLESPFLKYNDVKAFLQRSKLCILFYSVGFGSPVWVLDQDKPMYCKTHEVDEFSEPGSGIHLINKFQRTYLDVLTHRAYDSMGVRGGMNCEDRSLDCLQIRSPINNEGNTADISDDNKDNEITNPLENMKEGSESTDEKENRNPLEVLFDLLISPVQSKLSQEEIVIIPEGSLYLVPFAALKDPQTGRFLSETKRIRFAPSLVALKTLQECPADYHSKTGALVIGNPQVGQVMFRGEKKELPSLPSSEIEANVVSHHMRVKALIGPQATKEKVKERLAEGVAIIHIAAHGDSRNGEIVLAPSKPAKEKGIPEEEDYLLTMKEVQEIGVRAQLVVLSCCHSGRGDIEPEGVVGMSRAFLAAGARAVIASLWAIDDNVTLIFMARLYSSLKSGCSASASLQQAMNEIRRGHEEPKYWAPFFLIGDDVTLP